MVRKQRFVLVVVLWFALAALLVPLSATAQSTVEKSESTFVRVMEVSHFIWLSWLSRVSGWTKAGSGMDPDGQPVEAGSGMDPDGASVEAGSGMDPDGTPVEAGSGMDPDGNH